MSMQPIVSSSDSFNFRFLANLGRKEHPFGILPESEIPITDESSGLLTQNNRYFFQRVGALDPESLERAFKKSPEIDADLYPLFLHALAGLEKLESAFRTNRRNIELACKIERIFQTARQSYISSFEARAKAEVEVKEEKIQSEEKIWQIIIVPEPIDPSKIQSFREEKASEQLITKSIWVHPKEYAPNDFETMLSLLEGNFGPSLDPEKVDFSHGPYANALWTKETNTKNMTVKNMFFLNASVLGARGNMGSTEQICLLTGKIVHCASATLKDLPRWGQNVHFIIDQEEKKLKVTRRQMRKCSLTIGQTSIPMDLYKLLNKLHKISGTDSRFLQMTRFFTQGPINDMVYQMTGDIIEKYGACLVPNSKKMRIAFKVLTKEFNEETQKVTRSFMICINGSFHAGVLPNGSTVEPDDNIELGVFNGTTLINYETGNAVVRTVAKINSEAWKLSSNAHN